ncbi:MAG: alcohol dehydrogenase catalytic domain-containing protein [Spirochaetota bacterium]
MREKMKAALFYGSKEDMRLEDVDVPHVGEGDILIRVKACGICGSDARSYFNGIEERYKLPIILGHELTAVVERIGGSVEGFSPGDRVVVAPVYGCGQCEFCISGRENLCNSVVVFGCTYDGGYAEYMLIPSGGVQRGVLVKIGEDVSDVGGTMIEPFSCCLHGLRRVRIQPGDSVLVFGAGPIGIAHMMLAKKLGAGRVAVLDLVETRLKEASEFGADLTIDLRKDSWEKTARDFTGKNGADIVVTAAPSVAAITDALRVIKSDGRILVFGGLPHGSVLSFDPNIIHYREVTITGSIDATIDDFKRAAEMAPSLKLERFITHSFGLDDVKKGMEVMRKKEGLKVVLEVK